MNPEYAMADPPTEKTILVVEDNCQAAKLLSLYLAQAGYRAILAKTGEEALKKAAQFHPQAITLDILLPDMDGWQVLTRLKESKATRDIPVVIISVLDRQPLGFQLGAMEYLVKPVDRSQLLRAIGRCVLRERFAVEPQKVMVVHDELVELRVTASMLALEGYDVIEAMGSAEAVNLAKSVRPDLIVMDILSSGPGCFDIIVALRADPGTSHIPALILADQYLTTEEQTRLCGEAVPFILWTPGAEQSLLAAIDQLFRNSDHLRKR